MKNQVTLSIIGALLLSITSLQATQPIKIGISAALTGSSSSLGKSYLKGAKQIFDQKNKEGGIRGRKIQLIIYDDGYNPEKTVKNTLTLIKKDKVDLLYGYIGTPTTLATLPLLLNEKNNQRYIPLFFPFTGAKILRKEQFKSVIFHIRSDYYQETEALVAYLMEKNEKKIGVFYQIDSYGREGWSGVKESLKKRGLKITAEATYKRGSKFENSYKEQVKILKDKNVNAIIMIASYQAAAGLIRDINAEKWKVDILTLSFANIEEALSLLKDTKTPVLTSRVVPKTNLNAVEEEGKQSAKALVLLLENTTLPLKEDVLLTQKQPKAIIELEEKNAH